MKDRKKYIFIFTLSQIAISVLIFLLFRVLLWDFKNQIQDKRLAEHISNFSERLSNREDTLKLLARELIYSPEFSKILKKGIGDRSILIANSQFFTEYMKINSLNIFEVGTGDGIVVFRFHRTDDFGDNKSNQKIIQEALKGKLVTTLELGKSGLALRATIPFEGGTLLLGQTFDRDFLSKLIFSDDMKIALLNNNELVATSDDIIKDFLSENKNYDFNERISFHQKSYYITKQSYNTQGNSNLELKFVFMINEDSLESLVNRITAIFIFLSAFVVSIISFFVSKELDKTNAKLEIQKENATKALIELEDSQKNMMKSERLITLGTMVGGVVHEINTPLGAIKSSSGNIENSAKSLISFLKEVANSWTLKEWNLVQSIIEASLNSGKNYNSSDQRKLKKSMISEFEKRQIPRSTFVAEKILELGLVENEDIKEQILSHSEILSILNVSSEIVGIINKSNLIEQASDKVNKIVKAIKSFLHYDQSEEMTKVSIIDLIETVLVILNNKLKYGIEVVTHYDELPEIYCYPDELSQVLTNLIHNSIQAMGMTGKLLIEVKLEALGDSEKERFSNTSQIAICIEDSGPGIPKEVQSKIFEPFFTTKKSGEGSGLGLHITKKIIEKHQGTLELYTIPGCTRFTVRIPARTVS